MEMLFEKGTRKKVRFQSDRGAITIEQAWDLSLESLDALAQKVNAEVKASETGSFINKKSTANADLTLQLEILKKIIEVKLAEREARATRAEKAAKRRQLQELLVTKENEAMGGLTLDQVKEQLAALDAEPAEE